MWPMDVTLKTGCILGIIAIFFWAERWVNAEMVRVSGQWPLVLPFVLPIGGAIGVSAALLVSCLAHN